MDERDFRFERMLRRVDSRFYYRYIEGLRKAVADGKVDEYTEYVKTQEKPNIVPVRIRRMLSAIEKGYDK